jgi:hypothetical protein
MLINAKYFENDYKKKGPLQLKLDSLSASNTKV